jgi:hypothetical protein
MRKALALGVLVTALLSLALPAAANNIHLYSYDPADAATRQAAGPLTFQVRKGLLHTTVVNLRSTEAQATADLRPASAGVLGRGGLERVAGTKPDERDLYEVQPADQGPALISALCPGSKRAWLAFGRVQMNQNLRIEVIGTAPGAAPRLCHVLAYSFHGEWRAPATGPVLRERDLPHGRFPGT